MRPLLLPLLLTLVLGIGCNGETKEAYYGFFGPEAVVLVTEGKHLVVMNLPSALVEGYAGISGLDRREAVVDLVGVPAKAYFGTDESSLAEVRSLVWTLASEGGQIPRSDMTDDQGLNFLQKSAGRLRKTPFVSTLEKLTALPDGLSLLEGMKVCHAYDVGQFVTIDTNTDWKWLKEYLGRWLAGALLLE
ncbi:hypothetical protein [Sphaerochaeta sp. PS]|uniref:hypothetical protein n=1 Tax=Sphaerochaeta sp. PS TaxID=3076336 RepID=UPI0028A456DC|nr:hypothetical protein [Sphaerochaeta sp. PS]MDT4762370.1 hypothetical protein [Sphaerochaeta sp. PS]